MGNHCAVKGKGNQPKLKEALEETVINTQPVDYHIEEEIIRGRCEIRETWIYRREDNLADGWESIQRIILVHRNFLSPKKEHQTDSLYISDLENNCAAYFAAGLRSLWGIENKLHYTEDVSMREDRECTKDRQAAANLALIRDFAFNIFKSKNKSIKYAAEVFANHNVYELYSILIRT